MSLFQRNSSFDQEAYARKIAARKNWPDTTPKPSRTTESKASVPERSDLNRWYESLRDICARESEGDIDHSTELEDLKDEIYGFLY
jgi:hypothetical protein